MRIFIFLFIVFLNVSVSAQKQNSQAELNKMIRENKELQEQIKKNPELAELMKTAMEQADEEEGNAGLATRAPKKDLARLNAIPKDKFTKQQLVGLCQKIYGSYLQNLPPNTKDRFSAALESCGTDAKKLQDAAILNFINKSPDGALLFALKAAITDPDDPMYWNNLAALLIQSGQEEKSIPILSHLIQSHPSSSIVWNNMGQAYFGLGDMTKASQFLDSCLKYNDTHPEANHTKGLIYRFAGNTIKSNYHFARETIVCYRKPVVEELKKSKSDEEIFKIARSRWPEPENYFVKLGLDKFRVPKLPASVEESNQLYQAHLDFRENIQNEIKKWAELDQQLVLQLTAPQLKQNGIYLDLVENVFLPHFESEKEKKILSWLNEEHSAENITYPTRGSIISRNGQIRTKVYLESNTKLLIENNRQDSIETYNKLNESLANPSQQEYINQKYEKIRIEREIKYCQQQIALADKYLSENAQNQPVGFEERITSFPGLINEAMFYKTLVPDDVQTALNAHHLVQLYLVYLDAYSAATIIAGTPQNGQNGHGVSIYCDVQQLKEQEYEMSLTTMLPAACRFKLVLAFVVGKVSLDCKKIEVEGGEGLIVGVEHEFKSGNTTLAVGVGVDTNTPFVSVGAKHQAYVTFDGEGNYSDAGLKGEIGVEVGGFGPTGESKMGYDIGINAGATVKMQAAGVESILTK